MRLAFVTKLVGRRKRLLHQDPPFRAFLFAVLPFLLQAALAQQGQTQGAANCASPANFDLPACQAAARLAGQGYGASQGYGEDLTLPRIPTIRDQSFPQVQSERAKTGGQPMADQRLPLPPEEPTDFQKFVAQSTGSLLQIFGAELFRNVPSTFAPVDLVPVTPDYIVGPGDQLLIRAWGQIDLSVSPIVDSAGAIYIPQIGSVAVAGLKFVQVHDCLKTAISRVFRNFDLTVNMGQLRSMQVFVLGQARQPGAYTVSSLSSLVNAIFASGGPNAHGSMRRIRLMRQDRVASEFDLYDLLLHGDKSKDQRLLAGDVIYIPAVGPQVAMVGSVNTPGIYELKEGGTLAEGLQLAGGLTPVASKERAIIERIENSTRSIVQVPPDAGAAAATTLQNGDVVSFLDVSPRFENAVTLRGNVADPIRMPWRPGMKIRDLIPDREALLTRDYWQTRNRLVLAGRRDGRAGSESSNLTALATPVSYSSSGFGMEDSRYDGRKTSAAIPVSDATSSAGAREASRGGPGSIGAAKDENISSGNRVERNALETNWSYAVIERRDPKDLTTTLIPFRLGKAIVEGDETENLPLEPGDVVTIFSTADIKVPQRLQSRYVRLEGEFESAGVYSVRPGETLRQLVQRAGGLTPQAYLFGSEFRRPSARAEQQQRLDDLVNSLERQVTSSAANVRGSVVSPEEAVSANTQIAAQRELVDKLRQVRAQGRIVLDIDPRDPRAEKLPDLPLEDGDVFAVPSKPSFVNVVGSVYNSTSFVYSESKQLGGYLHEAGGATRTGDSSHAFLIRADGSVVSRAWSAGFLGASFEGLHLNPGDTVVIPEQINKATFLKGLKDWAQIFAQFALGAAAINILR